ncbi:MAG: hypothetical protein IIB62_13025, partial [Proteobacteria bacterium]|nr:hypothetical protein [Pseudomonadota bacterium]
VELAAYLLVLLNSDPTLANRLIWTYRNTIGPAPKLDYRLNCQACFYLRGPDAPPLDCPSLNEQSVVHDVSAPDARPGVRYHTWQKPDELAERFVRHGSKQGDLVCDPFCGTGAFVSAAARLGRQVGGDQRKLSIRHITCIALLPTPVIIQAGDRGQGHAILRLLPNFGESQTALSLNPPFLDGHIEPGCSAEALL